MTQVNQKVALSIDNLAGLHLYRDGDWDHCPNGLDDAARLVEEACGEPVTLVEHRSDLTYWTARLRQQV